MALPLANNAEGGSNGTTVTQGSAGNSGGISGNYFDTVNIGANMTLAFDSTTAANGLLSYKIALTSTATAITNLIWTSASLVSAQTSLFGRFYFRTNSASIPSSVRLIGFYAAGALKGYIGAQNTNAGFHWRTAADATSGTTSSAISANTWYRIEFNAVPGGVSTLKIYSGNSITTLGTDGVSLSGGLSASNIDEVRFGPNTTNFSTVSGNAIWLDDINLNTTGYPGPAIAFTKNTSVNQSINRSNTY